MTIEAAYKKIITALGDLYPEGEADAMAAWLLESLTGINRSSLRLQAEFVLRADTIQTLDSHLQRLLKHEPLQYVLGESWFCGLKFFVDERVLIPRPETEELVEWVISHCKFPVDQLSILDIGTGSGCIPISLKRRIRKADVYGCDISQGALDVARQNAIQLGVAVEFLEIDFLNNQQRELLPKADIIVSNPPYIPESNKADMSPNVLDFEPHTALFVPEDDPLLFYKAIASFGQTHLNERGMIFMEIHEGQAADVQALFAASGFQTECRRDMEGKERMVRCWNL